MKLVRLYREFLFVERNHGFLKIFHFVELLDLAFRFLGWARWNMFRTSLPSKRRCHQDGRTDWCCHCWPRMGSGIALVGIPSHATEERCQTLEFVIFILETIDVYDSLCQNRGHGCQIVCDHTWDQGPYRSSPTGVCNTICMSYATDILESVEFFWWPHGASKGYQPFERHTFCWDKGNRPWQRECVLVLVFQKNTLFGISGQQLQVPQPFIPLMFLIVSHMPHMHIEGASHWLGEAWWSGCQGGSPANKGRIWSDDHRWAGRR